MLRIMNTPKTKNTRGYKLSFIANTVTGGICLLLAFISGILEACFPVLRGQMGTSAIMATAVAILFVASLQYSKYVNLNK